MTILVAKNKHTGERVSIFEYQDEMKNDLICDEGHELLARRGTKKMYHFAHKKKEFDINCICSREKGTWHCWHQKRIQKEYIEIIYPERKHIADCRNKSGLVIEFQKSIVPEKVILEREQYYNKMIWVFCMDEHDFEILEQKKDLVRLKMIKGSKYFLCAKKPTYLDWSQKKDMIKVLGYKKNEIIGKFIDIDDFDQSYLQDILISNADKKETKIIIDYEKSMPNEEQEMLKKWL